MSGRETDEPRGWVIECVTKATVPEVDVGPEIFGDLSLCKRRVQRMNDRPPDDSHGDYLSGVEVTSIDCHRNSWIRCEHFTETGVGRTREPPERSALVQEPHGPYRGPVGPIRSEPCNQWASKEFFNFHGLEGSCAGRRPARGRLAPEAKRRRASFGSRCPKRHRVLKSHLVGQGHGCGLMGRVSPIPTT